MDGWQSMAIFLQMKSVAVAILCQMIYIVFVQLDKFLLMKSIAKAWQLQYVR